MMEDSEIWQEGKGIDGQAMRELVWYQRTLVHGACSGITFVQESV